MKIFNKQQKNDYHLQQETHYQHHVPSTYNNSQSHSHSIAL